MSKPWKDSAKVDSCRNKGERESSRTTNRESNRDMDRSEGISILDTREIEDPTRRNPPKRARASTFATVGSFTSAAAFASNSTIGTICSGGESARIKGIESVVSTERVRGSSPASTFAATDWVSDSYKR